MSPLLSVVMSVYNGARFLHSAIESILTQSFSDFEFIIVDDGSTDYSREIVSRYAKIDERIRLIGQENCGQAAALNRGCALARGEYIARMDADDVALSTRFGRQMAFLREHPGIGLFGGAIQEIDAQDNPIRTMIFPTTDEEIRRCEMQFNCFCHPTVVFPKQIFEETGGYRRAFVHADDYDLWLRLAEQRRVANLPEIVLNYRMQGDQITARSLRQQLISLLGAKVAARARRAGRTEPYQQETPVTMEDLRAFRVSPAEIGETFRQAFGSIVTRMAEESVTAVASDWLNDHFLRNCLRDASLETLALMHKYRAKGEYRNGNLLQCGLSLLKMTALGSDMFRRLLSEQIARYARTLSTHHPKVL